MDKTVANIPGVPFFIRHETYISFVFISIFFCSFKRKQFKKAMTPESNEYGEYIFINSRAIYYPMRTQPVNINSY